MLLFWLFLISYVEASSDPRDDSYQPTNTDHAKPSPPDRHNLNIVESRLLYGNNHTQWRKEVEQNPFISKSKKQSILGRINSEHNSKLMGIEFETPDLKVKYDPQKPAGFYFFRHGNVAWALEEDTFDDRNAANPYRNNLECRSVGGFSKPGIDWIAHEMGTVLKEITQQCVENGKEPKFKGSPESKPPQFPFSKERLAQSLDSKTYITLKNQEQPWLDVKLKDSKTAKGDIEIRPQITYQVGLEKLEQVFRRACDLKSTAIQRFMVVMGLSESKKTSAQGAGQRIRDRFSQRRAGLSSNADAATRSGDSFGNTERVEKIDRDSVESSEREERDVLGKAFEGLKWVERNGDEARSLVECLEKSERDSLNEKWASGWEEIIQKVLMPVTEDYQHQNDKLKGFILLFSFYFYRFFNNDQSVTNEAGLKKYASIMSRVPFSQLYWCCLSEEERKEFRRIFDKIISKYKSYFRLRHYTREDQVRPGGVELVIQKKELGASLGQYNGSTGVSNNLFSISLGEWYDSIVSEDRDVNGKIKPDLLSPAPGLMPIDNTPYSMGAMDIASVGGIPLFEVRSYATTSRGHIEDVVKLVYNESSWFFKNLN